MKADRVTAWCRRATRGINLFDADKMSQTWNGVKVVVEFFSHMDLERPFFTKWNDVLSKYLRKLPDGYTLSFSTENVSYALLVRWIVLLMSMYLPLHLILAAKQFLKTYFTLILLMQLI